MHSTTFFSPRSKEIWQLFHNREGIYSRRMDHKTVIITEEGSESQIIARLSHTANIFHYFVYLVPLESVIFLKQVERKVSMLTGSGCPSTCGLSCRMSHSLLQKSSTAYYMREGHCYPIHSHTHKSAY